jgi:hypothetical protein
LNRLVSAAFLPRFRAMGRALGRSSAAVASIVACLIVPAAARADGGSISGATIDSQGTQVSVADMTVTIDSCPSIDGLLGAAGCGAEARVVPASDACPLSAGGGLNLWSADRFGTSGGRTMTSGPRSIAVSSPVAYRVCLYGVHYSQNYGEQIALQAFAVTPAPTPTGKQPSGSSGGSDARATAIRKCKKRLPKGPRRARCIRKAKKLAG